MSTGTWVKWQKENNSLQIMKMLCELSLLFNRKEGVEEQFPEVTENSLYDKLWKQLDKRELRDFGSTKHNSTFEF